MSIRVPLKVAETLAGRLRKVLRQRGKELTANQALCLVTNIFGYSSPRGMAQAIKVKSVSVADRMVNEKLRKKRRAGYRKRLSFHLGLTTSEANDVLSSIGCEGWWGFPVIDVDSPKKERPANAEPAPSANHPLEFAIADLRPSSIRIAFENVAVPRRLARSLNLFARDCGLEVLGRNDLIAKIFGYEDFTELEAGVDARAPDVPDWLATPEQMHGRVAEYLRVLSSCGFTLDQAVQAMRTVGTGGWWQFSERTRDHPGSPPTRSPGLADEAANVQ